MTLDPGTPLGQYEVLSSLGTGGMGEVYRARDTKLGREVALKLLLRGVADDPERLARFEREARVLASLNHANIATLYGFESVGATRFLVMELIEGETLRDRLRRGPLPVEETTALCTQIASGLEAAHARGIVHRDLKPENVKMTRGDGGSDPATAKILDFGLAKALQPFASEQQAEVATTMAIDGTRAGTVMGTPAYMSPEQWRAQSVDRRTDVWAFGCLVFEMLTGAQVFDGRSGSDIAAAVLEHEPDWSALPAATPPALRRLLRRCLRKDAASRLRDIGDARIEIEEARTGVQDDPGVPAPGAKVSLPRAVIALAAAALIGGLATWSLVRAPDDGADGAGGSAPVAHLTFHAPTGASFSDLSSLSVSPDGEHIAYVASTSNSPPTLWIRSLDRLESRQLPGTEGALHPFWSPDSRSIGYFAERKLRVVEAAGGPPRDICDVNEARGGTWNQHGTILFAADVFDSLYTVSSSGGEVRIATVLDREHGQASHRWPSFLPDGRSFIAWVADTTILGLFLGSLDSRELTPLLAADGNAHPVARDDGSVELLYVRDGTVLGQTLDVATRSMVGTPEVVAEGVWQNTYAWGLTGFAASTTGTVVSRGGGVRKTRLVWVDRQGAILEEVGEPDLFIDMAYSPAANAVMICRYANENVEANVWRRDLARSTFTRVSSADLRDAQGSAWSRDGRGIAMAARQGGTNDLYVQNADGSGELVLVHDTSTISHPYDWSPDGRFLLYGESRRGVTAADSVMDLWALPISSTLPSELRPTGEPELVVGDAGDDWAGRFSPDGRWVAYTSRDGDRTEVFVSPFPRPSSSSRTPVSPRGGHHPAWRADGRELYYMAPDRRLMAVEVDTSSGFRAGSPRPLFHRNFGGNTWIFSGNDYAPSPDGQRFLIMEPMSEPGEDEIRVLLNR